MGCQYKEECPSRSGWCESPKQDFSKCIPFLISAYQNKEINEDGKEDNNTLSGLPRISSSYNGGYTKAIQDIIEVFNYIQDDLAFHHKKLNHKLSKELLKCCLDNRGNLRDRRGGFIRFNHKKQGFEFFNPNK